MLPYKLIMRSTGVPKVHTILLTVIEIIKVVARIVGLSLSVSVLTRLLLCEIFFTFILAHDILRGIRYLGLLTVMKLDFFTLYLCLKI